MERTVKIMTPKVSVVLPVYNGEKYLQRAIDSVLAQTFKDYEFIIVNDGSVDRTPKILEAYESDSRFKILHQQNQGVAQAMNVALDIAQGEYVACITHDDFWIPNKLATEVETIEHANPKIGVVYSNFYSHEEETQTVTPKDIHKKFGLFSRELVLRHCVVNIGSAIIRRKFLMRLRDKDGFICDRNLDTVMDWDLWIRLSRFCEFKHIPNFLSYYNLHKGQISRGAKHISQRWILYTRWNGFNLNYFANKVLRAHFRRLLPPEFKKLFRKFRSVKG